MEPTDGVDVAEAAARNAGPGVATAERVDAEQRPLVSAPGRMPGRRNNGHTTSGLDFAMSQMADKIHPTGG